MNDLLANLDKLHTTDLGAERIKGNLNLRTDDVVLWCKKAVEQHDVIFGMGGVSDYRGKARSCRKR
jgi:hypothetical protein